MVESEIPLEGGAFSRVVRIGDTVRRPLTAKSPYTQELLVHLEAAGFDGAPRALGFDDQGREVLSFVDGEVGVGLPAYVWEDHVLAELGHLLRRFHDAASTFPCLGSPPWDKPHSLPLETICHDDVVPWNTVFRNGRPCALIDWDRCAAGSRVFDLSYAAASFVPLGDEERCRSLGGPSGLDNQGRRLRLLMNAYGMDLDVSLFDSLIFRFEMMKESIPRLAKEGNERMQGLVHRGGLAEVDRTIAWLNMEGRALLI